MAFFIADHEKAPEKSYGRYLGIVSPNATKRHRFFAVEFDTHISEDFADPSASHIGIDINSLKSLIYADTSSNASSPYYPDLYLYNNYTFIAWIEYHAPRNLIQVWMSNAISSPRPHRPCLKLAYNLSDVFQDFMYVGFSASNNASEDGMEGHVLYSWNFTTYPPRSNKWPPLLYLIVPLFSLLLLLLCCISLCYIRRVRRKRRASKQPKLVTYYRNGSSGRHYIKQLMEGSNLQEYTYKELRKASHSFAESYKIGEGTFSIVYKATLSNGQTIAIKRMKERYRKHMEFSSEMKIISSLRHRNLLPLLGWCYDKGEALLIYKYMSKGSLNHYLYGQNRGTLSSEVRFTILAGVASALEYLHDHLKDCVLHRDVKAANVLLTEDFEPMLGDFGLARLIDHTEDSVTMTAAGSPGYVAPEVVYTNKATNKADVYSFGVLALVIACGRPAMLRFVEAQHPEEVRLLDWVWMLHQGNQLMEAIDVTMRMGMSDTEKKQWGCVLHVALMCSNPSPDLRPTMRQACQALQGGDLTLMKPLPATKPIYPMSQSWPSASESPLHKEGDSLFVMPSASKGYLSSSPGYPSSSDSLGQLASLTSFACGENGIGR
ncbi:hypothetical protein L7F22_032302 [Adiantum nelumboides]|nr:hypothetical protein [Adiantum nelumboides]